MLNLTINPSVGVISAGSRLPRTVAKVAAGVAAACIALTLWPTTASAVATDAVRGCGATDVVAKKSATVPKSVQSSEIFHVSTTDGRFSIKCGNGTSYGAVHIEVKHEVPDWPDALSCITKAIDGSLGIFDVGTGKTRYTYSFHGGTVKVAVGGVGIITAFPTGGSVVSKWKACSTS